MTKKEFKERCEREVREKEPELANACVEDIENIKKVIGEYIVLGIIGVPLCFLNAFLGGLVLMVGYYLIGVIGPGSELEDNAIKIVFVKLIVKYLAKKRTKKYYKNDAYMSYPINYPYSFVYEGELYPFNNVNNSVIQTYATPVVAQVQPIKQAQPVVAQVQPIKAVVAQVVPVSKEIFCNNCGSKLTVPVGNNSIQVTCSSCGYSFVYTPSNLCVHNIL